MITTGSQGEPSSALVRIARDDHRQIRILPNDTVIISASAIPGNEKVVNRTINNLVRKGARVLYDRIATVHVHGHAAREELKAVLTLTKPRYFVPIHGEFKGLAAHAALAKQMGVKEDNVFLMQDGEVLEFSESGGRRLKRVVAGNVYLDGVNLIDADSFPVGGASNSRQRRRGDNRVEPGQPHGRPRRGAGNRFQRIHRGCGAG